MKISQISDTHLDFYNTVPDWKNPGSDVLILGGDICNANQIYRNPSDTKPGIIHKDDHIHNVRCYREFFRHVSNEWKNIILIAGNHEHYSGRWEQTSDIMRQEMSNYPNIYFLEQDKMVIDDVVFLGATLWTSMNNSDPLTMMSIRDIMNDYKHIAHYNVHAAWGRLMPYTTVAKFHESVQWLKLMLSEDKRKTVVVTHHAPSHRSIHSNYHNQPIVNSAFASDLDEFIMDHPHIALWTHGHTHNAIDYNIDNTRIINNPFGYPNEKNTGFNPNLIIEI